MPGQWVAALQSSTREQYPALLSYAAMLTGDLDAARALTDAAITSVMGRLRTPRDAPAREYAIHAQIARRFLTQQAHDAGARKAPSTPSGVGALGTSTAAAPPSSVYAPAQTVTEGTGAARDQDDGIGIGKTDSALAGALRDLTPPERVAALGWWVDGVSAAEVADRIGAGSPVAVDALHRAGIALARACGVSAPPREHYLSTSDVITVEATTRRGRS